VLRQPSGTCTANYPQPARQSSQTLTGQSVTALYLAVQPE